MGVHARAHTHAPRASSEGALPLEYGQCSTTSTESLQVDANGESDDEMTQGGVVGVRTGLCGRVFLCCERWTADVDCV